MLGSFLELISYSNIPHLAPNSTSTFAPGPQTDYEGAKEYALVYEKIQQHYRRRRRVFSSPIDIITYKPYELKDNSQKDV
ncbi:hypothetical protein PG990_010402 [Apiospora arundinis]